MRDFWVGLPEQAACRSALLGQAGNRHLKSSSLGDNKWRLLGWLFICFYLSDPKHKMQVAQQSEPGQESRFWPGSLSLAMKAQLTGTEHSSSPDPYHHEQRSLPGSHSPAQQRQGASGGVKFYK